MASELPVAAIILAVVLIAMAAWPGRAPAAPLDQIVENDNGTTGNDSPRVLPIAIRPAVTVAGALIVGSLGVLKVLAPDANADQQVGLIKALLWPAFATVALVLFADPIGGLLARIKTFSIDPKSGKLSFDTVAKAAEQHLKRARAKKYEQSRALGILSVLPEYPTHMRPRSIRGLINERTTLVFHSSRILWADDNPPGNQNEIEAFQDIGIDVQTVRSTDEAMESLRASSYDLVLSDMNRPPDKTAGLALVRNMRSAGLRTPVMLYVGKPLSEESRKAAEEMGVALVTTDPYELFDAVTRYLIASKPS